MKRSAQITPPPERSLEQRRRALRRANTIRHLRATDKDLIKNRKLDARAVIMDPPEYWRAARIPDVMMAVPAVGTGKVERILRSLRISPSRTMGALTEHQRQLICESLAHFYPNPVIAEKNPDIISASRLVPPQDLDA